MSQTKLRVLLYDGGYGDDCDGIPRELLTHCGRVTQICVFNTVKLGTSASSP